jgi:hypothetical protein|tara:strand:- start:459 stop:998 length:540 start_codon:yes stop_codon:yes gene_type:complete
MKYDMTTFFKDGFYTGDVDINVQIFDDVKFPSIDYNPEDLKLPDNCKQEIKKVQEQLEEVISETYPKFELTEEPGLWNGVTKENNEFHNDFVAGDKFNSNILVYLDEGNDMNENYIEIAGEDILDKDGIPYGVSKCRIFCRPGQFVWLNQSPQFEHRANNGSGNRRLIHFAYYIPEIKK